MKLKSELGVTIHIRNPNQILTQETDPQVNR